VSCDSWPSNRSGLLAAHCSKYSQKAFSQPVPQTKHQQSGKMLLYYTRKYANMQSALRNDGQPA